MNPSIFNECVTQLGLKKICDPKLTLLSLQLRYRGSIGSHNFIDGLSELCLVIATVEIVATL